MLIAEMIVGGLLLIALVIIAIICNRRNKIIDEYNMEYLNKKKKYCFFICLTMVMTFIVFLTLTLIFALYCEWLQTALCMVPSMIISFTVAVRYYALSITIRHKIIHLNNKNTKN